MLSELRVRELALVESADVRFGAGLNLLTGETGSGKSLIIDGLGLTLGERAQLDQVRHGAERALVEAYFELPLGVTASAILEAIGEQADGGVVLTRELGKRSLARIAGRPVSPAQLRELGEALVAVHGQSATGSHHPLRDSEQQMLLLDSFGGCTFLREKVGAAFRAWTDTRRELEDLEQLSARGRREEEYLRWQLAELQEAHLRAGEEEDLVAQRAVLRHAVRLRELSRQATDGLSDDSLALAAARVASAAELDPSLAEASARLRIAQQEVADIAVDLRRYEEAMEADPVRLEELEGRLAQLEAIKRKFGGSVESAIAEQDRLALQLGRTEDLEGAILAAGRRASEARSELESFSLQLSTSRSAAAATMSSEVTSELQGLRLGGAEFRVELRNQEIGPNGGDEVVMVFSANPGEPMAPVQRVASGGELARLMLAISAVNAESDAIPTLIFDEVDAGIGGEAAVQVGKRLKHLAQRRQVLVVTHLPQIACYADHHLVVEKVPGEEGRNRVNVRELRTDGERAAELARMMSGAVTEKGLARAAELLQEAAT